MEKIILLDFASKVNIDEALSVSKHQLPSYQFIIAESSQNRLGRLPEHAIDCIVWQSLESFEIGVIERVSACFPLLTLRVVEEICKNALGKYYQLVVGEHTRQQILGMAQRNAVNKYSLMEITRYINFSVSLFVAYLEYVRPLKVIAYELPHELTNYILMVAADHLHIPCYSMFPTVIDRHYTVVELNRGTFEPSWELLGNKINSSLKPTNRVIEEYCNRLADSCSGCNKRIQPYDSSFSLHMEILNVRKVRSKQRLLSDTKSILFLKKYKEAFEEYKTRAWSIDELIEHQNNSGQQTIYHYYPLHYEPEMTSLPGGGPQFPDQISVISYILSNISEQDVLLVKEHPAQLTFGYICDGDHYLDFPDSYRSKMFYTAITADPRVHLVDMQVSSKQIFSYLKPIVWSLTGTAAAEAYLLGNDIKTISIFSPWRTLGHCNETVESDHTKVDLLKRYMKKYLIKVPRCLSVSDLNDLIGLFDQNSTPSTPNKNY